MDVKQKAICLSTILTLVMASGAVAIGFTSFVQAEIKEDVAIVRDNQLLNNEKITSLQIQLAEMRGDIKLILAESKAQP